MFACVILTYGVIAAESDRATAPQPPPDMMLTMRRWNVTPGMDYFRHTTRLYSSLQARPVRPPIVSRFLLLESSWVSAIHLQPHVYATILAHASTLELSL